MNINNNKSYRDRYQALILRFFLYYTLRFNSLWSSDVIYRHITNLAQISGSNKGLASVRRRAITLTRVAIFHNFYSEFSKFYPRKCVSKYCLQNTSNCFLPSMHQCLKSDINPGPYTVVITMLVNLHLPIYAGTTLLSGAPVTHFNPSVDK